MTVVAFWRFICQDCYTTVVRCPGVVGPPICATCQWLNALPAEDEKAMAANAYACPGIAETLIARRSIAIIRRGSVI